MTETNAHDKLWEMIDDIGVAMLTTETPDGLESRPMAPFVDRPAGKIWFLTRIDTAKTSEIADDSKVNVAFADKAKNSFVSVTGTARVLRDPAKQKELWSAFAEAWMPEGPDAPTTALIAVDPTHGTLWDSPGKIAQLFQVAKANITQTPPSGDRVEHVTL